MREMFFTLETRYRYNVSPRSNLMRSTLTRVLLIMLLTLAVGCGGKDAPVDAKATEDDFADIGTFMAPDSEGPLRDNDPRIVVKVNGDPITWGEINTTANTLVHAKGLSPLTPEGQKELLTIRPNVFETLLTSLLLKQGSKDVKIKIDPKLVDKQIESAQSKYPDEETFRKALEKEGLTIEKYREIITDEIRVRTFMVQVMRRDIKDPSDEEIEAFYNTSISRYKTDEKTRLSIIVIGYSGDSTITQKQDAFSTINGLYFRIMAGEDFAELAKEYSTGPNAENGGDIGYKDRSAVAQYLEKAPEYKLAVGNLTPVLETPTGYVLLMPTEIVPAKDHSLEDVREEIIKSLTERRKAENVQKWLDQQMNKAEVEIVEPELYRLVAVSD